MEVGIKRNAGVPLPEYATNGSAGVDLRAMSLLKLYNGQEEVDISKLHTLSKGFFHMRGFERALVGTGLFVEIPEGYEWQIRSRSGRTLKNGLIVANAPGTIDSDFRGEVCVILVNNTKSLVKIQLKELVAQAVLTKFERIVWREKETLSDTQRGEGGFGHTGNK